MENTQQVSNFTSDSNNTSNLNTNSNETTNNSTYATATTQQARASVASHVDNMGFATVMSYDDNNNYLYDNSGQLVTKPGWHKYNAYYSVQERGSDFLTNKNGETWFYVLNNGTAALQ